MEKERIYFQHVFNFALFLLQSRAPRAAAGPAPLSRRAAFAAHCAGPVASVCDGTKSLQPDMKALEQGITFEFEFEVCR